MALTIGMAHLKESGTGTCPAPSAWLNALMPTTTTPVRIDTTMAVALLRPTFMVDLLCYPFVSSCRSANRRGGGGAGSGVGASGHLIGRACPRSSTAEHPLR